ncbi:MAG: hypothetical protein R2759_01950 [Bacteroidales bacterium]
MNAKRKDIINRMNTLGAKRQPFVFIIDFAAEKPMLFMPDELADSGIRIHLPSLPQNPAQIEEAKFEFQKEPISFQYYSGAFNRVQEAIHRAIRFVEPYLSHTRIKTNLSLSEIFERSRAPFRLKFKEDFVVFSARRICDN